MPYPMWKEKSSSVRGGGGDIGIIVGIVRDFMIVDGLIFRVLLPGIEGYLLIGEITIETICGTDVPGIIIPFLTVTWIGIGEAVIGERKEGNILVDTVVIVVVMVDMMIDTRDN